MLLSASLIDEYPSLQGTLSKAESSQYPPYSGSYDVTPKAYSDQILETANKVLTKNVTIHKVPFMSAHNESGTTIYIAKEAI